MQTAGLSPCGVLEVLAIIAVSVADAFAASVNALGVGLHVDLDVDDAQAPDRPPAGARVRQRVLRCAMRVERAGL